MKLHQSEDLKTLSQSLADWLMLDIQKVLKEKDHYSFVLTGGNSPKDLYRLLASDPRKEKIEWHKIHFYIGDERYVPFDDDQNNGKMAHETLLDHIPVKKENIHLIDTSLSPEESASHYEELLKDRFGNANSSFDFVLLGMGGDGHTLSLFPGTEVIHEMDKWVASSFVKDQDMYRITLTRPIVNKAKNIAFLVAGAGKANALKEVLEGEYQPDLYPAQTIYKDNKKKVHWFVDKAATSKLSGFDA